MDFENQLIEGGIAGLGQLQPIGGVGQHSDFFAKRQFPSLGAEHEAAFKTELLYGFAYSPPGSLFKAREVEYYHKLAVTTASLKLTFFNTAAQDWVTNLNNGDIPATRPMWLRWISLSILDVDAAGALTSNYAGLSAANTTAISNTIAAQKTLGNALVKLKVNREEEFQMIGGDRFPRGGGINANVSGFNGTGIAAGYAAASPNAGDAVAFNMRMFSRPIPLIPNRKVELTVEFQAATMPAACSIVATLGGTEVVSANFQ